LPAWTRKSSTELAGSPEVLAQDRRRARRSLEIDLGAVELHRHREQCRAVEHVHVALAFDDLRTRQIGEKSGPTAPGDLVELG
jgi:hypothetical protein